MTTYSFSNGGPSSRRPSHLNAGAPQFQPVPTPRKNFSNGHAVSSSPQMNPQALLSELSGRVRQLEEGQARMQGEIVELRSTYEEVAQVARQVKKEEEEEVSVTNIALQNGCHQAASATMSPSNTTSVPPHLRSNGALITDGKIDRVPMVMRPAPELTPPPTSPTTSFAPDVPRQSIEDPYVARSAQGWMPSAVLRFPNLHTDELSAVPPVNNTTTFSLQFLEDTFGGKHWSPGWKIVPPSEGVSLLPTRSYYLLDANFEPYLPREPGRNGAKLTAFFNEHPANVYGSDSNISFDNVPLFVCNTPWAHDNARRYVYFGNYSQTRWSDRLDYDRMQEYVPQRVKEFWAEELSAQGRDEWVSKALMKHFFPMPEYEGATFHGQPEGSVANGEEEKVEKKVQKDIEEYVKILKAWEEDAQLKTRLIKKDFIMQAFDRPDADDPPALRLWWEYLQCTKYDRKFYDVLVQLQSRRPEYLK